VARLLLKYEGVTLSTYPLEGGRISIGRLSGNDIHLDDPAISCQHACIVIEASTYLESIKDIYIEDLDSTNGTQVNDKKIKRVRLKHGDTIQIGKHLFVFDSEQVEDMERTAIYIPDK